VPFFQFKAVTPEGKVVEGTLEAADEKSANFRLEEQGQMPIRISSEEASGLLGREFRLPWERKRVSQHDLLVFTHELSTLSGAGLPLDRSLSILAQLSENDYLKEIVGDLLKEIKSGKSLSEGLALYPRVFPRIYINMVKAGEVGGALDVILERLREYLENSQELKSYIVSALIYPCILVFVAIVSFVILMGFVIPKFAVIFDNAGAPIPLPMQIMLFISAILSGYWWLIAAVAGISWYFFRRWLNTPEGRLIWDRRLLALPLLGPVLQKLEVSRFSRTLGTLLNSSVPLISSINLVKEVVNNQAIAVAMEPIKAGVKKGEGLVLPIRRENVFPPFALHLLEVGEEKRQKTNNRRDRKW
jgi:general secretion pathway protein F